jgi:hypothetical protein
VEKKEKILILQNIEGKIMTNKIVGGVSYSRISQSHIAAK